MQSLRNWLYTIRTNDSDALRRGQLSITIILLLGGLSLLALPLSFFQPNSATGLLNLFLGLAAGAGLLMIIRSGRVTLGASLLTAVLLLVTIAPLYQSDVTALSSFFLLLPIVTAGLMLRPIHVWIVLVVALICLGYSAFVGSQLLINNPGRTFLVSVVGLLLINVALLSFLGARATARALQAAESAQHEAEHTSQALAEANTMLENRVAERTAALQTALADLETRAAEQARLLQENNQQQQTIREMSVPILPVDRDTLAMPLVGALDSARLNSVREQALRALERTRARRILLDVTGVPVIDTLVGQEFIRIVEAARLLGAEVVLIGVRPEVAQTIVTLGMNLAAVRTSADLESALARGRQGDKETRRQGVGEIV